MPEHYQKADGWFDYANLYRRMVDEAEDGDLFVEVGCFQGRSALFLAEYIREVGKDIKIVCVDLWPSVHQLDRVLPLGSGQGSEAGKLRDLGTPVFDVFTDHFHNAGLEDYIYMIRKNSSQTAELFPDNYFKFIFIDAGHEYNQVMKDLVAWWPKVKVGGTMGGHDYPHGGVNRSVNEFFPSFSLEVTQELPHSWSVLKK